MDGEKVLTPTEQLTEYCDCIDLNERDVNELIDLVSTYTCWAQKPCETFLLSDRKEVVDLPDCAKNCDVFEFEPFYAPFNKDSFTFSLIEQNSITETVTPVTDYIYSEADEKFRLELPLPTCKCRPNPCGCKSNYKLMVTYVAGYENIPECLLPLFCDAIRWIHDKNKCDCEKCEVCDEDTYRNKLSLQFDYTTLDGQLQVQLLSVLSRQYFRQLSLISLCQRQHDLWAVVV